jgi:long-chain acyl-CoA synthetase
LIYPQVSLYEALASTAQHLPQAIAWDFFDTTMTFKQLIVAIDHCGNALSALGVRAADRILISLPTSPQAVIAFYAVNKIGAVSAFIHPLSTSAEIEYYLNATESTIVLTLDAFYQAVASANPVRALQTIVLAKMTDYLSPTKSLGFWLSKGRKIKKLPEDHRIRFWSSLMQAHYTPARKLKVNSDEPAVILFSGGTTGTPKGIVLTNRNFIAEGLQAATWGGISSGDSILAILPVFHGFGLGVCINAALMTGGKAILVPIFSADLVAKLIQQKRPNVLVGVPTLYAALTKDPLLQRTDLSCLKVTFSGADVLPHPVKENFERMIARQGGNVKLLTGYGLTEAVTAIMAMPVHAYRENSIGVPFPDMLAKICRLDCENSEDELPANEEGEICVSGPAVMQGYLNDPDDTAKALRKHSDGRVWLHTGDLGWMDGDGFFYFKERFKRVIKSSGFNVFPSQVEAVLYKHALVQAACVVGVPDSSQVERVKAYIVLKDQSLANPETEKELIEYCRSQLIKWSCPREIEFRDHLPLTRPGKIDYKQLVKEHIEKHSRDHSSIDHSSKHLPSNDQHRNGAAQ